MVNSIFKVGVNLASSVTICCLGNRAGFWNSQKEIAIAAGIPVIASIFNKIYPKQMPVKSLCSYSLAGVVLVLGRYAARSSFPIHVIAGLTALSYLTSLAVNKVLKNSPIEVSCNKDTSTAYFSLTSTKNIYVNAEQTKKTQREDYWNSSNWPNFVQKATGKFSLQGLAELFANKAPDLVLGNWNLSQESNSWFEDDFDMKIDTSLPNQKYNADDMRGAYLAEEKKKILIFSTADGSGKGEDPRCIAKAANKGFVEHMKSHAVCESLTLSKLVKLTTLAVNAAQQETLKAKRTDQEPANGCTTHLGVIAFIDENKMVHCCFSSVGDSILLAKYPDGKLVELTKKTDRPDVRDPGGQLGTKYLERESKEDEILYGKIPDLRNFTVGYAQLPKGTVLLPMTDGVYDNLELENIKELLNKHVGQEAINMIVDLAKLKQKKLDDTSCAWIELS